MYETFGVALAKEIGIERALHILEGSSKFNKLLAIILYVDTFFSQKCILEIAWT